MAQLAAGYIARRRLCGDRGRHRHRQESGLPDPRRACRPAPAACRWPSRPLPASSNQLVERELPFVQQLVPDLTYAQLQGRPNYLSLSRLAEEVEDALTENRLPPAACLGCWPLLLRFAEASAHGNLEELGYLRSRSTSTSKPTARFCRCSPASVPAATTARASRDNPISTAAPATMPKRADLVVVNHALLLNLFFRATTAARSDESHSPARRLRRGPHAGRGRHPGPRSNGQKSGDCAACCGPCTTRVARTGLDAGLPPQPGLPADHPRSGRPGRSGR